MNTKHRHGTAPYITVSHAGFTYHYTPQGDDWYALEECAIAALHHASRLAGGQLEYVTSEMAGDLMVAGTQWLDTEWFINRPSCRLDIPGDVEVKVV